MRVILQFCNFSSTVKTFSLLQKTSWEHRKKIICGLQTLLVTWVEQCATYSSEQQFLTVTVTKDYICNLLLHQKTMARKKVVSLRVQDNY